DGEVAVGHEIEALPAIAEPGHPAPWPGEGGHGAVAEEPQPAIVEPVARRDRRREGGIEPRGRDDSPPRPFAAPQNHLADAQEVARPEAQPRRRRGDAVAAARPFRSGDAERLEQRLAREVRKRLPAALDDEAADEGDGAAGINPALTRLFDEGPVEGEAMAI